MTKLALDDFLLAEKDAEIGASWTNWLAIGIMLLGVLSHFVFSFSVNVFVYLGIGLLALNILISYKNFLVGVKVTCIVLLLGFVGLAAFFPYQYTITLGFKDLQISFNVLPLVLLIVHVILHQNVFKKFIESKASEEEKEEEFKKRVEGFKRGFRSKDIWELEQIVNNEILLPEARKAAEELIKEEEE